jgi:hypothetical protein
MAGLQKSSFRPKRFDIDRIKRVAGRREAEIWQTLIYDHKAVSPELYNLRSSAYLPELPTKNKIKPTRQRLFAKKHRRSK